MTPVAWVNGRFVGADAELEAADEGLLSGLGLFETMGARGGALPLWSRHLERLRAAAPRLGLAAAWDDGELEAAARELLRLRGHEDGVLRLTMTAKTVRLTTRARTSLPPRLVLALSSARRSLADPTAGLKTISRAFLELARRRALARGADDALLLDESGRVLEATRWNLFVVASDAILTPATTAPLLPGIARGLLLEALKRSGRPVETRDVSLTELRTEHTLFVTNAVHGPWPAALPELGLGSAPRELVTELEDHWRALLDACSGNSRR